LGRKKQDAFFIQFGRAIERKEKRKLAGIDRRGGKGKGAEDGTGGGQPHRCQGKTQLGGKIQTKEKNCEQRMAEKRGRCGAYLNEIAALKGGKRKKQEGINI